jgi:predicted  nucleic acid-binding Zn-ribbon protein
VMDLKDKFVEIERRVKALVTENAGLEKRVAVLEKELADARRSSQEIEDLKGSKAHIREKIENILRQLEAVGGEK